MKTLVFAAALLAAMCSVERAQAGNPYYAPGCYSAPCNGSYGYGAHLSCCPRKNVTALYPWHGGYYNVAWGAAPVALVVPPTATLQTKWSWGVTNTDVVPNYYQFGRTYPGRYVGGGYGFLPQPPQPGSTDQFGVYYVRGPW